ncbi:hypothetical protein D3B19_12440 [Listeria monocytogenes]|nr:hypothetical protein M639_05035 [Listeria monocytogenes]RJD53571.1 hypothetical protein D3B19_12440 [Listeria monocytogenes]
MVAFLGIYIMYKEKWVFFYGCGLLEGLHDCFACMYIWPVTYFASNGRMGIWVFDRWWMDFGGG